jgi:hypothetical protein
MTAQLRIAFMNVSGKWAAHRHNHLVAFYTGCQYIHCEIFFPGENLTFTTDVRRRYVYAYKGHGNPDEGWCFVDVPCTLEGYRRAFEHCAYLAEHSAPFNTLGYFLFCFGVGVFAADRDAPPAERPYLCSRLVTEALQQAGVMADDVDEVQVTAATLWRDLHALLPETRTELSVAPLATPRKLVDSARYMVMDAVYTMRQ